MVFNMCKVYGNIFETFTIFQVNFSIFSGKNQLTKISEEIWVIWKNVTALLICRYRRIRFLNAEKRVRIHSPPRHLLHKRDGHAPEDLLHLVLEELGADVEAVAGRELFGQLQGGGPLGHHVARTTWPWRQMVSRFTQCCESGQGSTSQSTERIRIHCDKCKKKSWIMMVKPTYKTLSLLRNYVG